METCKRVENKKSCRCKSVLTDSCNRNGKCCDCIRYHLQRGGFPACIREALEKQKPNDGAGRHD